MKKIGAQILSSTAIVALSLPLMVSAASVPNLSGGNIGNTFRAILDFINTILVPTIFALAFLVFIWGVFKTFIMGGHDEEKQSEGKQLMIYAIIGFVVMVSVWGIVNLVAGGFGLNTDAGLQQIPRGPTI